MTEFLDAADGWENADFSRWRKQNLPGCLLDV